MRRKAIPWLLTIAMILSLLLSVPIAASADSGTDSVPVLTLGTVFRITENVVTVRFLSDVTGHSYYLVTSSATTPDKSDLSGWNSGGDVSGGTPTTLSNIELASGLRYVHIVVKDSSDLISDVLTVEIPSDYYYYENFEAYSLGTYVGSGALSPLQEINNGTGSANQKVIESVNHGSAKMLSLSSTSGWASDQVVLLDSTKLAASDSYAFEGNVYPLATDAWQLRLSFTKGSYGGSNEAGIFFKSGNIVSISDSETVLKNGYAANQWYAVKIVATPSTSKYAVYVNDELLSDTLTLPSGINRLAITSGHGKTAYFDDLKFYAIEADLTAPVLVEGVANRISATEATVTFSSEEAGEYYYAVTEAGASPPDIDTSGSGTPCDTTGQTISLASLTAGAKDIFIVVKDAAGNVSGALRMEIPAYIPPEPGTIQFEASSHSTYEGYNGWMIGVTRTDGSDGEVSVSYSMIDGTAKAGTHYQADSGTLTWGDGDSSRKAIMFTAYNDNIYNGYLDLTCVLSNPTGGAILGGQNPLNIRISDNDPPPVPTGLKATAGDGQVDISWDPVNSAYYKLYYSTVEGEVAGGTITEIYDGESCTITGLKNNTTYYFAIRADHGTYYSDLSGTVKVTPKAPSSGGGSSAPQRYPVKDGNQGAQVGGQTKLSKERAEAGDTVIITVAPEKGYESGKPVVLDSNKNHLEVVDNGDGTFSFKMPAGGVDVETKFDKIDYFDDVDKNDWFDEASWYCAAHGLIQGTGHRQFDGHLGTNRAMLVTVLYRLANSTDDIESIFDDVESGKWYSDAVGWAAHNKIVEGYGNGKFGPDDALTREQMVSVLYRYSLFMKYDTGRLNNLDAFTDVAAISDWALNPMKWAVGNGIVEGIGNNLVSPETGATRAQFAAMMQRYATTFVK